MEPLNQGQQEQMVQNEAVGATFLAAAAAAAFGKRKMVGKIKGACHLINPNPIRGNLFPIYRDYALINPPRQIRELFHGQLTWSEISLVSEVDDK